MALARYAFGSHALAWLLAMLAAAALCGCATTDEESDLPWNTPQSWEGSPGIPGLTPDM